MNFIKYIYYAIRNAIKRASKSTSSEEYEEFMENFYMPSCSKMIRIESPQQDEQIKKELELKFREMLNNKEIDENDYESIQRILAEHFDEGQNEDIDLKHDDESNADSNTDSDTEDG